jgi:xanthine/uracil permease
MVAGAVPAPAIIVTARTAPPQRPGSDTAVVRGDADAERRRGPAAWRRDVVAAVLWIVAVVPAAMGFWLVAGSIAGIGHSQVHTLVVASLLGLAIATLLQVALGFRLPMYEGPASAYLAAITVVTAQGDRGLPGITGGLLAAGAFVVVLGVLRVDRLMVKAFTPLVANVFVLTVTLAVMPATIERAIGGTHGLPGTGVAWAGTVVVVIVTLAMRRLPRLSPYSLLVALLAGTATHLALAGVPHVAISGGVAKPALFPWGAPSFNAGVVFPFLLAGALAAFNTVASGQVVAVAHELPVRRGAQRRAFVMHGAAQAGGAMLGNLVGTVSRLDSVGIVRLLDHRGRAPLMLAGILVAALALVHPVVDVAAALPLSVSAALLGVLLSLILAQVVTGIRRESRRVVALVVIPSLIPTAVWIAVGDSLPPAAQLIANPMLCGVLLAIVLERIVAPRTRVGLSRTER